MKRGMGRWGWALLATIVGLMAVRGALRRTPRTHSLPFDVGFITPGGWVVDDQTFKDNVISIHLRSGANPSDTISLLCSPTTAPVYIDRLVGMITGPEVRGGTSQTWDAAAMRSAQPVSIRQVTGERTTICLATWDSSTGRGDLRFGVIMHFIGDPGTALETMRGFLASIEVN